MKGADRGGRRSQLLETSDVTGGGPAAGAAPLGDGGGRTRVITAARAANDGLKAPRASADAIAAEPHVASSTDALNTLLRSAEAKSPAPKDRAEADLFVVIMMFQTS